jgi:hypothetical protein
MQESEGKQWLRKEGGGAGRPKERETAYAGDLLALSLTEAETKGVHCGTKEGQKSDWEVKSVRQRMAHDAERVQW